MNHLTAHILLLKYIWYQEKKIYKEEFHIITLLPLPRLSIFRDILK